MFCFISSSEGLGSQLVENGNRITCRVEELPLLSSSVLSVPDTLKLVDSAILCTSPMKMDNHKFL